MSIKRKLSRGFTLIELLIVIGLLAVLAGSIFAIFNPFGQIQKSQDAKRKSDLAQVQRALELYYQDNGRYPPSTASFQITGGAWGSSWSTYMARVPADPTAAKKYVYFTPAASNGQSYYLYTNLDRGANDPQSCNSGNACTTVQSAGFPGPNACGAVCNFGMTSPNVTP
jgi:general secretion pathway protein G